MNEKYIEDIKEIKEIMNRSTRFISLSGLSGVSTGITALVGVFVAYQTIFKDHNYLVYNTVEIESESLWLLMAIAVVTLVISIGNAIFFTRRETKKHNQSSWDNQSKRLLINLSIPLISGGLLCLILLLKGFVGILPSLTLIFYGLALVNGSKYSLVEIKSLGLIEICIGLIAIQFIEYSLLFWALGFGVIQIAYGLFVQRNYKL